MKEPVDARISFVGLLAALAGVAYLALRFHADHPLLAVMLVYGVSMCALFGASALYHGVPVSTRATAVLRRIDHAAIYVLIAGTYTPVLFVGLDGTWRIATTASIWGVALAGIVLTIWFVRAPRWLSAAIYIAMGWLAVVPAVKVVPILPHAATVLIGVGGLFYTLGAVVYATKSLNVRPRRFGFHEIFHLFVLAGAVTHFTAIAGFLVRSGTSSASQQHAVRAQQGDRGDRVVDAAVGAGRERIVEAHPDDLDALDRILGLSGSGKREVRGQVQVDRFLDDRRDLVRLPERVPARRDHAGLLARLALRAGEAVLSGVTAALDHFEHDRVDREACLPCQQHVIAVDENDGARARRHDHAVDARRPGRMDDVVGLEAQPRVLVDGALGAANVPGTAHAPPVASPVLRRTKRPGSME
ncbi:MAG: hypothetical protein NVS4B13_08410 [Candidatus Elarobacter sp.]